MSGGKGGSQKTEIPSWLSEPLQRNIARGEAAGQMDYTPFAGPAIAELPTGGLKQTGQMLSAFGMAPQGADASGEFMTQGLPEVTEMGGVRGYSSMPMYDAAMAEFERRDPRSAAIRAGLYSTSAEDVLAPMNAKLGEYYNSGEV